MRRYADMIEQGLAERGEDVVVERIDLAPSAETLARYPAVLRNRLHHLAIARRAVQLRGTLADSVVHVLDGSFAYVVQLIAPRHSVVTCHDLIPYLQCQGLLGSRPSFPARYIIQRSCKGLVRATRVVTICQQVRQEVIDFVGMNPDAVSVISSPLAAIWTRQDLATVHMDRQHMLHVGNGAFYKNREAVIRIFSTVAQHWPGRLVMAGAPPDEQLRTVASSLGLSDRIDFISNPSDEDLRELYLSAKLFVFPSLTEGYGWPPLEAVACGCPVVASDVGGIKEVLGAEGGRWFEPTDEAGMAAACLELLTKPEMAAAIVEAGQKGLENVSIPRLTEALMAVYSEARRCTS
jgi:glycosyltransferase involved in cell wall biosynthesis